MSMSTLNTSTPIAMSAMHDVAVAQAVEHPDVVIVGAGPAGLSAATALKQAGIHSVVVLERQAEAGGIPRHCGHSPFGMREFRRILSGHAYAQRLRQAAVDAGADLRLLHSVVSVDEGPILTVAAPQGMIAFAPRAVILATGVREMTRASRLVSGARPLGIMNTAALQDMVHLRHLTPFKRPLIVGTELVSMSAILTCLTAGARPAAVIEPGPHTLVRAPFGWLPHVLRIPVHHGAEIIDISGAPSVQSVTLRRTTGEVLEIECDGIVFTGKFTPEANLARMSGLRLDEGSGGPAVDTGGRTSRQGVYAAGNVLRGVETAGWCWAEGRAVAEAVASDLSRTAAVQANPVAVEAGSGIKLVMPQRIAPPDTARAFDKLQLRLQGRTRGALEIECDGRTIWSRPVSSGPERRILVPIADLLLPSNAKKITIRIRERQVTP